MPSNATETASWGTAQFMAAKLPETLAMYSTAIYSGHAAGSPGLRLYLFGGTITNLSRSNVLYFLDAASPSDAERLKVHFFGGSVPPVECHMNFLRRIGVPDDGTDTASLEHSQSDLSSSLPLPPTTTFTTSSPSVSPLTSPMVSPRLMAGRPLSPRSPGTSLAPPSRAIDELLAENERLRKRVQDLEKENAGLIAVVRNQFQSPVAPEAHVAAAAHLNRSVDELLAAIALLGIQR